MANKIKKVYGVNDIVEWECSISVGKSNIHFPFTDGGVSVVGSTPATFITSNPVLQNVLESSAEFKSGRIFIVRKIEMDSNNNVIPDRGNDIPKMSDDDYDDESVQNEPEKDQQADSPSADGMVHIQVANINEAKDYLVDNLGVTASSVSTKSKITSVAAQHNIVFDYQ